MWVVLMQNAKTGSIFLKLNKKFDLARYKLQYTQLEIGIEKIF